MSVQDTAPVLFISHGAPSFALEAGLLGPLLQSLGQQLSHIKAVLVVSPHWQTTNVTVMTTAQPDTVHDFGGFAAKLYTLQYPAAGAPALAQQAAQLLVASGFSTQQDEHRGLDHGAWVPLMHLFPQANVPVFQVSMPHSLSTQQAVQLGQALAPLRAQGVLIVASGSMTHNLYEVQAPASTPVAYAQEFSNWITTAVLANTINPVIHYRTQAPHAQRAHPTEEHFLPLLVALGAKAEHDSVQALAGGITHGVLSMDSFVWGMA
jgi:4,5-DOPA dioxygenase extradiol